MRSTDLGACQHLIEFTDDSCDLFGCFRREATISLKMLSNQVRGSRYLFLKFKELIDVGTTPLDESLELRKVGDVPLSRRAPRVLKGIPVSDAASRRLIPLRFRSSTTRRPRSLSSSLPLLHVLLLY